MTPGMLRMVTQPPLGSGFPNAPEANIYTPLGAGGYCTMWLTARSR